MTRRTMSRFATVASVLAATCFSAAPALAGPAPDAVTLDGAPVEATTGAAPGNVCAAINDGANAERCFSSPSMAAGAVASALRQGEVPPGWTSLPPAADIPALVAKLEAEASSHAGAGRPPQGAAAASRRRGHAPKARKADGYDCSNAGRTYIYTDANFGGTGGYTGYTGVDSWANYNSTFDNRGSSFWAMPSYTSRWHDYAYGGGAYYGNGYACRFVENLTNANMTDGGTANDRFSSVATW